MQIIIPMSGFGERFRKVGYTVPKPLIQIDGKPIVQHVVEMFSDEDDIVFICNRDHLNCKEYRMREILEEIAPNGVIHAIDPHKLGPVHAVLKVIDYIDLGKPTIVNYADFTCDWDYADFCSNVKQSKCDGSIPCYRGFHPHTLWSNYYAYVEEVGMQALDIQEKTPFTDSPREEFASSGTYYFKSGKLMQHYFERCVEENLTVGGEYYVSMVYKPMMEDHLNIKVYELEHFMQWGTPSDLEEYRYWSNTFSAMISKKDRPKHEGALILPMVGLGSRFEKEGYKLPKPMIPVSGKLMALQALINLPIATRQRFILREDMKDIDLLKTSLKKAEPCAEFTVLDHMTDGQASTCVEGAVGLSMDQPVTIAACDNGMIYDAAKFQKLMDRDDVDIIVWGARGYPGAIRSPDMYGWIDTNEHGTIKQVSVKKPLSNPITDLIVVGSFTFKKISDFLNSVERMKGREAKVNGEYYVDTAINDALALGLRCVVFEIDHYICWGTPNDLRTFEYWQACFNGWKSHPYKIDNNL
jgi:NDP-sugar pyrophosphorylase family protein